MSSKQLLHRFTQPGNPTEVKEIENRLRELQLSPQGWEIGDFLLGHQNPIFRFFGAVTFRVKLGTSSHELDEIALSQITQRLLGWLPVLPRRLHFLSPASPQPGHLQHAGRSHRIHLR